MLLHDPFSPKNRELDAGTVEAILVKLGVLDGADPLRPLHEAIAAAGYRPRSLRFSSPGGSR